MEKSRPLSCKDRWRPPSSLPCGVCCRSEAKRGGRWGNCRRSRWRMLWRRMPGACEAERSQPGAAAGMAFATGGEIGHASGGNDFFDCAENQTGVVSKCSLQSQRAAILKLGVTNRAANIEKPENQSLWGIPLPGCAVAEQADWLPPEALFIHGKNRNIGGFSPANPKRNEPHRTGGTERIHNRGVLAFADNSRRAGSRRRRC